MITRDNPTRALSTLRALALSMLPNAVRGDSCRNYHTPRLDYICLYRVPEYTVKLYDIRGGEGFVVAPHDHRYPFQTFVLSGQMQNVTFVEAEGEQKRHRFHFRTQFLGGPPEFSYTGETGLYIDNQNYLEPGDGYTLSTDKIHTIIVPVDSLLLLFQHEDEPKTHTRLYMETAHPPSLEGLYQPFDEHEFSARKLELIWRLTGRAGERMVGA